MFCIVIRTDEICETALFLPSRYNNSLTTTNTHTEACFIYILNICLLDLKFIYCGLIFVEKCLNLFYIYCILSFNLNWFLFPIYTLLWSRKSDSFTSSSSFDIFSSAFRCRCFSTVETLVCGNYRLYRSPQYR